MKRLRGHKWEEVEEQEESEEDARMQTCRLKQHKDNKKRALVHRIWWEWCTHKPLQPPPTMWVMLIVSLYTAVYVQALSCRTTEVPGQNTKAQGGSMRALDSAEYFLLQPNIQNPSLFFCWHVAPSIQLRQANHCTKGTTWAREYFGLN